MRSQSCCFLLVLAALLFVSPASATHHSKVPGESWNVSSGRGGPPGLRRDPLLRDPQLGSVVGGQLKRLQLNPPARFRIVLDHIFTSWIAAFCRYDLRKARVEKPRFRIAELSLVAT
jgi:hypothetical protein